MIEKETGRCCDRGADERGGLDGVDAGAKNSLSVVAKLTGRSAQCSCFGSDQAERPVTALNLRNKPAIS